MPSAEYIDLCATSSLVTPAAAQTIANACNFVSAKGCGYVAGWAKVRGQSRYIRTCSPFKPSLSHLVASLDRRLSPGFVPAYKVADAPDGHRLGVLSSSGRIVVAARGIRCAEVLDLYTAEVCTAQETAGKDSEAHQWYQAEVVLPNGQVVVHDATFRRSDISEICDVRVLEWQPASSSSSSGSSGGTSSPPAVAAAAAADHGPVGATATGRGTVGAGQGFAQSSPSSSQHGNADTLSNTTLTGCSSPSALSHTRLNTRLGSTDCPGAASLEANVLLGSSAADVIKHSSARHEPLDFTSNLTRSGVRNACTPNGLVPCEQTLSLINTSLSTQVDHVTKTQTGPGAVGDATRCQRHTTATKSWLQSGADADALASCSAGAQTGIVAQLPEAGNGADTFEVTGCCAACVAAALGDSSACVALLGQVQAVTAGPDSQAGQPELQPAAEAASGRAAGLAPECAAGAGAAGSSELPVVAQPTVLCPAGCRAHADKSAALTHTAVTHVGKASSSELAARGLGLLSHNHTKEGPSLMLKSHSEMLMLSSELQPLGALQEPVMPSHSVASHDGRGAASVCGAGKCAAACDGDCGIGSNAAAAISLGAAVCGASEPQGMLHKAGCVATNTQVPAIRSAGVSVCDEHTTTTTGSRGLQQQQSPQQQQQGLGGSSSAILHQQQQQQQPGLGGKIGVQQQQQQSGLGLSCSSAQQQQQQGRVLVVKHQHEPNAALVAVLDVAKQQLLLAVVAVADIAAGSEVMLDYGDGYWSERLAELNGQSMRARQMQQLREDRDAWKAECQALKGQIKAAADAQVAAERQLQLQLERAAGTAGGAAVAAPGVGLQLPQQQQQQQQGDKGVAELQQQLKQVQLEADQSRAAAEGAAAEAAAHSAQLTAHKQQVQQLTAELAATRQQLAAAKQHVAAAQKQAAAAQRCLAATGSLLGQMRKEAAKVKKLPAAAPATDGGLSKGSTAQQLVVKQQPEQQEQQGDGQSAGSVLLLPPQEERQQTVVCDAEAAAAAATAVKAVVEPAAPARVNVLCVKQQQWQQQQQQQKPSSGQQQEGSLAVAKGSAYAVAAGCSTAPQATKANCPEGSAQAVAAAAAVAAASAAAAASGASGQPRIKHYSQIQEQKQQQIQPPAPPAMEQQQLVEQSRDGTGTTAAAAATTTYAAAHLRKAQLFQQQQQQQGTSKQQHSPALLLASGCLPDSATPGQQLAAVRLITAHKQHKQRCLVKPAVEVSAHTRGAPAATTNAAAAAVAAAAVQVDGTDASPTAAGVVKVAATAGSAANAHVEKTGAAATGEAATRAALHAPSAGCAAAGAVGPAAHGGSSGAAKPESGAAKHSVLLLPAKRPATWQPDGCQGEAQPGKQPHPANSRSRSTAGSSSKPKTVQLSVAEPAAAAAAAAAVAAAAGAAAAAGKKRVRFCLTPDVRIFEQDVAVMQPAVGTVQQQAAGQRMAKQCRKEGQEAVQTQAVQTQAVQPQAVQQSAPPPAAAAAATAAAAARFAAAGGSCVPHTELLAQQQQQQQRQQLRQQLRQQRQQERRQKLLVLHRQRQQHEQQQQHTQEVPQQKTEQASSSAGLKQSAGRVRARLQQALEKPSGGQLPVAAGAAGQSTALQNQGAAEKVQQQQKQQQRAAVNVPQQPPEETQALGQQDKPQGQLQQQGQGKKQQQQQQQRQSSPDSAFDLRKVLLHIEQQAGEDAAAAPDEEDTMRHWRPAWQQRQQQQQQREREQQQKDEEAAASPAGETVQSAPALLLGLQRFGGLQGLSSGLAAGSGLAAASSNDAGIPASSGFGGAGVGSGLLHSVQLSGPYPYTGALLDIGLSSAVATTTDAADCDCLLAVGTNGSAAKQQQQQAGLSKNQLRKQKRRLKKQVKRRQQHQQKGAKQGQAGKQPKWQQQQQRRQQQQSDQLSSLLDMSLDAVAGVLSKQRVL